MFWSSWSFWLYVAAWAPHLGCLVAYGIRSPWRRSAVGRALFTLYAALTAVLSLVLLVRVFDLPDALRDVLRVLTVGGVSIAGFVQLAIILRLQRDDRRVDASSY